MNSMLVQTLQSERELQSILKNSKEIPLKIKAEQEEKAKLIQQVQNCNETIKGYREITDKFKRRLQAEEEANYQKDIQIKQLEYQQRMMSELLCERAKNIAEAMSLNQQFTQVVLEANEEVQNLFRNIEGPNREAVDELFTRIIISNQAIVEAENSRKTCEELLAKLLEMGADL